MSRDWNIIDEEVVEAPQDDSRLNLHRVRLVATERRAATRARQWALGIALLGMIAAAILATRAIGWMAAGEHRSWAVGMLTTTAALIVVAIRLLRRHERDVHAPAEDDRPLN